MTDIERVRALCKERGIPVHALEKALGFSNGYLNPKKAKTISYERMIKIAAFLNVPISQIFMGDGHAAGKKSPAPEEGEADKIMSFIYSLPKERIRGILVALGAPEEVLSELDQQ